MNLKSILRTVKGTGRSATPAKRWNVDTERKLIFVHNPKCAGTSARHSLGFSIKTADHRYPKDYVSKNEWEVFTVIAIIREPLSRLISAYRYHCQSNYSGAYLKAFPNLKNLNLRDYLGIVRSGAIVGMGPQHLFLTHPDSDKAADIVLTFEDIQWSKIPERFIVKPISHLNTLKQNMAAQSPLHLTLSVVRDALDYLETDYKHLCQYNIPHLSALDKYGIVISG